MDSRIVQLAKWIIEDDLRADNDGDCSFRDLLAWVYGMGPTDVSDYSFAAAQLSIAGLITRKSARTEHVGSWRTPLGKRVHALVCAMEGAEGAEDMGGSGRGW